MIIFRFVLAYERKCKQRDQPQESCTRHGWKEAVNFCEASSKNMSLCSFTQGEKRHPNRCSCDVGTFIWRHQKNHKCKHISLVWECFVLQPVILLWWPKVISDSFCRITIGLFRVSSACGEGRTVCSVWFPKKWGCTQRCASSWSTDCV